MLALIRDGLGLAAQRRVQAHHAVIYQAIAGLNATGGVPDVLRIYKELVDKHNGMVMSRLYRSLKLLEEAKLIERHWIADAGRVRSGYSLAGQACKPAHGHVLCEHCGGELPGS